MSSSNNRNPALFLSRFTSDAVESMATASGKFFRLLVWGPFGGRGTSSSDSETDSLADYPHLVRLFRSALAGNADKFTAVLSEFTKNSDRIQHVLILWLDLIEVLVHDAERRHGAKPGQGKIKAAEVKQAFSYVLESGKFSLPNIPQPLVTLLAESLVEGAINIVVLQANRYDLWEGDVEEISLLHRIWDAIKKVLVTVSVSIANMVARVILGIRKLLQPRLAISPALKSALDAIMEEGEIAHEKSLVVRVSELFIWLGTHRSEIVQATELIFGAVQEAETLINLSGPEKKEFARDLIWRVLEETGLVVRAGLAEALIDSIIDLLIEFSVHAFNKRGAFVNESEEPVLELT